jgi:hypothetical protein
LRKKGKISVGKMEKKRTLGRPRNRWQNKIKIKWNGRGCTEVTWLVKGASGRLL